MVGSRIDAEVADGEAELGFDLAQSIKGQGLVVGRSFADLPLSRILDEKGKRIYDALLFKLGQWREEIRKKAQATGLWPAGKKAIKEGGRDYELIAQENKIVMPSSFSPLQ